MLRRFGFVGLLRFIHTQHHLVKSQEFANRPGLERAAARHVRWIGVGNLGYVSKAGFVQMFEERFEKFLARLVASRRTIPTDTHPRFNKRPDEPRPDGT